MSMYVRAGLFLGAIDQNDCFIGLVFGKSKDLIKQKIKSLGYRPYGTISKKHKGTLQKHWKRTKVKNE